MSITSRHAGSLHGILEDLRKGLQFSQYVFFTTLPRGELQIALASVEGSSLLKSYTRGFHSEDRLTWGAIKRQQAVVPADVWHNGSFGASDYWRDLMAPNQLEHVVALPLKAPVLPGYPGAVHLCRTAAEGAFTAEEIEEASRRIAEIEPHLPSCDAQRRHPDAAAAASPTEALLVLDSTLHPLLHQHEWSQVDARVRDQMIEQAQRRMHQLNGSGILADRVQFPDSRGNVVVFRVVTYRKYPALGEGAMSFFCPQPACSEWGNLQSVDFQADAELARLIPAVQYMQENFRQGPTLVDIAKTVHLSPFHFHRRFTELLGLTPKQFLLGCQIYEAKVELLAGDKELAAIGAACGFAHQSHFTSRFKQATGLTPTRWRRMMSDRASASTN